MWTAQLPHPSALPQHAAPPQQQILAPLHNVHALMRAWGDGPQQAEPDAAAAPSMQLLSSYWHLQHSSSLAPRRGWYVLSFDRLQPPTHWPYYTMPLSSLLRMDDPIIQLAAGRSGTMGEVACSDQRGACHMGHSVATTPHLHSCPIT